MAILRSHHIALKTPNLDRLEAFYRDVVGLSKCGQLDIPGMRIVFYDLGGVRLELIEVPGLEQEAETGRKGLSHVAVEVDDVYATAEALGKRGVTFHDGPKQVGDLNVAFFRDPDGTELELFQGKV
ncbi:MAG TPA: VOC family protein [Armatimonadota bacterium]